MRIAYLDCFSGISGDMFLGAAVEADVPLDRLQSVARSLGVAAELKATRVMRGGISATKIDVLIAGHPDSPLDVDEHSHETHSHKAHSHSHGTHSHSHAAAAAHSHGLEMHSHDAGHSHGHTHRGLPEIRLIIDGAPISDGAKAFAVKTFELLAEAEGKIHNRPPEAIHFHEVGSEDAIVDIVCSAVAIEEIGAGAWYCSALNVGSGTVRCAHGVLPVPAPATAELLRGAPIYSGDVKKELLTPTGAALLKALGVRYEAVPKFVLSATGYGAGGRDFPGTANVVRLLIGEEATALGDSETSVTGAEETDSVVVMEANIDDMNPQIFSYVQQKLLKAGALDAFAVPVQMKKGRPGMIFTVLAKAGDVEELSRILLTETTTLGVRMRTEQRRILQREHVTVASCWGPIRVKLGRLDGAIVNFAPEFEDCRAIAESTGVPLKSVLQEATRLYLASAPKSS